MNKLLSALILVFAIGCATPRVPDNRAVRTPFGDFTLAKDMDLEIEDLKYERGTNGVVLLTAKAIRSKSRNNPDAIAAGTAQIDAHYAGASKVVEKGVEAGIKAASKGAVP